MPQKPFQQCKTLILVCFEKTWRRRLLLNAVKKDCLPTELGTWGIDPNDGAYEISYYDQSTTYPRYAYDHTVFPTVLRTVGNSAGRPLLSLLAPGPSHSV
ncbi:hypothetical protein AVEN_248107-1 [Araneus ventricosus]|uniref:Uncharacterized protein n=1 Tax=Araneus ventricosus TaxID=182803 RepID=A0A4Y2SLV4_ARAVE|nr:hypothetical protein AVEN_248107-1 [Araneus ventricosus]